MPTSVSGNNRFKPHTPGTNASGGRKRVPVNNSQMSNFIFLACNAEKKTAVSSFFEAQDSEIRFSAHGSAFLFSKDMPCFYGNSIDHQKRRVTYQGCPQQFWPDPKEPLEGCYIRIDNSGERILISTDIFRQIPIFYFSESGVAAASDSLFTLTEIRKHLGFPCTPNEEALIARSWRNAMAAQMLGTETLVAQIRFCPLGKWLEIDTSKPGISVSENGKTAATLFQSDVTSYEETLFEACQRSADLLLTLANIPGCNITLSLSGGMDSRVCLAACLASGIKKQVSVMSSKYQEDDFAVVSALSDAFSIPINASATIKPKITRIDALSSWMVFNAGIYDPLYSLGAVARGSLHFPVGGHGAELYKGQYGWRPIWRIAKNVPAEIARQFASQCGKGLSAIGVDEQDAWGSEWHYLGYRNVFHAGRSTMTSLKTMRPLLQRKLIGLSRSDLNKFPAPKKGEPSIVSDMLIVLSPELAVHPFDDAKKDMSADYVIERRRQLVGSKTLKPLPYEVIGTPADLNAGPSLHSLQLAKVRGFFGGLKKNHIERLALSGFEKLPPSMRGFYESKLELIRGYSNDDYVPNFLSSTAAGKLMSFNLFTD